MAPWCMGSRPAAAVSSSRVISYPYIARPDRETVASNTSDSPPAFSSFWNLRTASSGVASADDCGILLS